MMNCIAIDDEPLALELLKDNISKLPFLNLVAACNNAFEAMETMEKQAVDLVFIDIQMPGLTGLQFIASLEKKPLVIFITPTNNMLWKAMILTLWIISLNQWPWNVLLKPVIGPRNFMN